MQVVVAKRLLQANDQIAEMNRKRFDAAGVAAINLLGSPGAGKTSLIEALVPELAAKMRLAVVEGDLATTRDADRVAQLGLPTVQINTSGACHLDAGMVASALDSLTLDGLDLLIIENVGNLVCPSSYRLGEHFRTVVLSVPEGDDKVAKYPTMFQRVDSLVINKLDLLPHVRFDLERVRADVKVVAPTVASFALSAATGEGIAEYTAWLEQRCEQIREGKG